MYRLVELDVVLLELVFFWDKVKGFDVVFERVNVNGLDVVEIKV